MTKQEAYKIVYNDILNRDIGWAVRCKKWET